MTVRLGRHNDADQTALSLWVTCRHAAKAPSRKKAADYPPRELFLTHTQLYIYTYIFFNQLEGLSDHALCTNIHPQGRDGIHAMRFQK